MSELVPTITGYVLNPGEAMPTECPQCYRFVNGMEPDAREGVPAHDQLHLTGTGQCSAFNNKVLDDKGIPTFCTCPHRPRG